MWVTRAEEGEEDEWGFAGEWIEGEVDTGGEDGEAEEEGTDHQFLQTRLNPFSVSFSILLSLLPSRGIPIHSDPIISFLLLPQDISRNSMSFPLSSILYDLPRSQHSIA